MLTTSNVAGCTPQGTYLASLMVVVNDEPMTETIRVGRTTVRAASTLGLMQFPVALLGHVEDPIPSPVGFLDVDPEALGVGLVPLGSSLNPAGTAGSASITTDLVGVVTIEAEALARGSHGIQESTREAPEALEQCTDSNLDIAPTTPSYQPVGDEVLVPQGTTAPRAGKGLSLLD